MPIPAPRSPAMRFRSEEAAMKPSEPTTAPTMSVDEAAAMLGVNRKTLYKALKAGNFPGLRFERRIRVSRTAVEAALRDGSLAGNGQGGR
jgi:excisionase family DNA binding protein